MNKQNVDSLKEQSFEFSLHMLSYCEELKNDEKNVMANQLLKSGVEIGKLIQGLELANSRLGIAHKLNNILDNINAVEYWLRLCNESPEHPENELEPMLLQIKEIVIAEKTSI